MGILKTIRNTSRLVWVVLGNSDNQELTGGTNIYIAQLNLVELIAEISKFLATKIIGTQREKYVKVQTAVRTEPKMSVMKMSR